MYTEMLEILLVYIIGAFYSLYLFIATKFFFKSRYYINSHKETYTVSPPFATMWPSFPH